MGGVPTHFRVSENRCDAGLLTFADPARPCKAWTTNLGPGRVTPDPEDLRVPRGHRGGFSGMGEPWLQSQGPGPLAVPSSFLG